MDLYRDLRRIASAIMPRDIRASRYQIEPFDGRLHYSPRRALRPEVTLSLRILHRRGYSIPIDACERECLGEMSGRLRALGAREER